MTKRHTAADFANAKFAEHPAGGRGHRIGPNEWRLGDSTCRFSTEEMIRDGWVPVPSKPTITDSEVGEIAEEESDDWLLGFISGFEKAGGEVVPDPEPTDEELLAGIIRGIDDWQSITSPELLAKYLNTAGVTPPKEDK